MQEIKYIPIEKLEVDPKNPRTIKDNQFRILCESVKNNKDYFETRPVLVSPIPSSDKFKIFAGLQRFLAGKEIGMTSVPVAVMDISESRRKELMLRDNRQSGEWDLEELANFEESLLSMVGFEPEEIDKIFQGESDEDDFEAEAEYEKIQTPKIQAGDLFILGGEVECPKCGKIHKL